MKSLTHAEQQDVYQSRLDFSHENNAVYGYNTRSPIRIRIPSRLKRRVNPMEGQGSYQTSLDLGIEVTAQEISRVM